jgi:hypothetical protein
MKCYDQMKQYCVRTDYVHDKMPASNHVDATVLEVVTGESMA